MTMADPCTPTMLEQSGPSELLIQWADGHESRYDVAMLRRSCRCAVCVDEWTGQKRLADADVPDTVRPLRVRRVGRYALGFEWSDGHSSGIYTFDYLRSLCPCDECAGE